MAKKGKKKNQNAKKVESRVVLHSAPVAKAASVKGATAPKITNHADGSCTIAHQEYCLDVAALALSTGGSAYVEGLNPQRASLFTWLSAIATRFEMYRFEKLRFMYKPSCATTTGGYVIMGFDFDAYDQEAVVTSANAPGKAELLAWKYSRKCAPWEEMMLDLTPDSRLSTFRYCDFSSRGDRRLDLLGNFVLRAVQTTEQNSAVFVGEIFVEYVVRFRQPSYKIPPALFSSISNAMWPALGQWFTPESFAAKTGNLALERVDNQNVLVKDAGDYLLTVLLTAASGISASPTVTAAAPAASPSANYSFNNLYQAAISTAASSLYRLSVETPPVLLSFPNGTGTDINSSVLFSTYK